MTGPGEAGSGTGEADESEQLLDMVTGLAVLGLVFGAAVGIVGFVCVHCGCCDCFSCGASPKRPSRRGRHVVGDSSLRGSGRGRGGRHGHRCAGMHELLPDELQQIQAGMAMSEMALRQHEMAARQEEAMQEIAMLSAAYAARQHGANGRLAQAAGARNGRGYEHENEDPRAPLTADHDDPK